MSTIKSNESDLTIERAPQGELPELAVRILSDFARSSPPRRVFSNRISSVRRKPSSARFTSHQR
jgi:hypothetical protein